jgi:protein-tyrosine kinase
MQQLMHSLDLTSDENGRRENIIPTPVQGPRPGADRINYKRVESVPLNKAVLRGNRVLTGHEPTAVRESYQLLRTRVLQRLKENQWNTLAVTSPRASSGTTLTAINLAVSLAREIAYTVVLVDTNLRYPSLLRLLGLDDRPGLSEYLTSVIPVENLLLRSYFLEDLVLLPSGRAAENSAELLNSPKMERLVADLKASDDRCIIVFDLPPVLETADTLAFSPQVDAALLVIEEGVTTKTDLVHAVEILDTTNIVGTVMNKAGASAWK